MVRYKIKISKENKKNKIVCFRVDWNSKIGYGHYKRCLALANLSLSNMAVAKSALAIFALANLD